LIPSIPDICPQDTYYAGNIKGIGRIYQQTFTDAYSRVAFAKPYETRHAITFADIPNDRVLPFFEENQTPLLSDQIATTACHLTGQSTT